MIERALLIENVDAVLVTVDHKGELHWISGHTETLRDYLEVEPVPNLKWYRVDSDDFHVHPAANGTPPYEFHENFFPFLNDRRTRHVKNFVKNLRKSAKTNILGDGPGDWENLVKPGEEINPNDVEGFVWSAPVKR